MSQDLKRVSKLLSYVLRHKPEAIGLTLDPEGWALIDDIISKADIKLSHDLILKVVKENEKQRFALTPDALYIRANQGHSIDVNLGLVPMTPPETLYHGTADRFIDSIMKTGLSSRNRQHVHLSSDHETAFAVGKRHGKPVILEISALSMHENGYQFYQSENGVWLTNAVPQSYILKA